MNNLYIITNNIVYPSRVKMLNFYKKGSFVFENKIKYYKDTYENVYIYKLKFPSNNVTENFLEINNNKILKITKKNSKNFRFVNMCKGYVSDKQYEVPYPFSIYSPFLKQNFIGVDATDYYKHFNDEFLEKEGFIWENKNLKLEYDIEDHIHCR